MIAENVGLPSAPQNPGEFNLQYGNTGGDERLQYGERILDTLEIPVQINDRGGVFVGFRTA